MYNRLNGLNGLKSLNNLGGYKDTSLNELDD